MLGVVVEDAETGQKWAPTGLRPDALINDVLSALNDLGAVTSHGLPIVALLYAGQLAKHDSPLSQFPDPRHFYTCVRKGDDAPLSPAPLSPQDLEELGRSFDESVLQSVSRQDLQWLRQTPFRLDDVILAYFWLMVGKDPERVRKYVDCVSEELGVHDNYPRANT
jgi:hypothetical protein